jgi:Lrp/AsnC family leucine-responsive transcriptional regulator
LDKETTIDKTDVKILKLLLGESRTSFTDIAKCCGISVGAVRMRYARLKQTGVVTGEIMQVNPYVLGYKCISDLVIKTTQENEAEVGAFLKTKPYLVQIVNAANNYTFWAKVMLHDIKELNGIIAELECHP